MKDTKTDKRPKAGGGALRKVAHPVGVKLKWAESGGPLVREPTRRNFGTRLIGRLADQLHGDVRVKYDPAGVVYELEAPMAALRAVEAS